MQRGKYDLHFVEADDEGWFWDPEQARAARQAVEDSVRESDTFVITFVHGWHHSAACCDGNVVGFEKVLQRIHNRLDRTMYAQHQRPFRVIGIYVGWRGQSLPGFLDYLTFWSRKEAAERVGETDFQEFMIRLKNLYEDPPKSGSGGHNRLGLITIGHSFGGQVVLRATSSFIEHRLANLAARPGYLRGKPEASTRDAVKEPVTGFGDLVVLINPAVEASAYGRLFTLGQSLEYASSQTPVMLTLSADDDRPRDRAFRWGRISGEWFGGKPGKDDPRERMLERRALGLYAGQVTHRLAPLNKRLRLKASTRGSDLAAAPGCPRGGEDCECTWYEWPDKDDESPVDDSLPSDRKPLAEWDFSDETIFNEVALRPKRNKKAIPYQALMVATVHPAVITGHNGIFSEPFLDFLTSYIGWIELKKFGSGLPSPNQPPPAQQKAY